MPDGSTGVAGLATSALAAAKQAIDLLLDGSTETSTENEQAAAPPSSSVSSLEARTAVESGAGQAIERYRTTSRWILGAFGAFGVLVFGSLPFTNITSDERSTGLIVVGLSMAIMGITLVIWAASTVAEPEDASLGELKDELAKLEPTDPAPPEPTDLSQKDLLLARFRNPTTLTLRKLRDELDGEDGTNHVGPTYPGVPAGTDADGRLNGLIRSVERARQARYVASATLDSRLARSVRSAEELATRTTQVATAWDRWTKVTITGGSSTDSQDTAPLAPIDDERSQLWTDMQEAQSSWRTARDRAWSAAGEARTAQARLAEIDAKLAVHLQHRDSVIEQAAFAQLKGTFRLARWVLVFGAILTGLGATIYALGLPDDAAMSDEAPALMRFVPSDVQTDLETPALVRITGLVGEETTCGDEDLQAEIGETLDGTVQVVVGGSAPKQCHGLWTLPPGSWYLVARQPPPRSTTTTTPSTTPTT